MDSARLIGKNPMLIFITVMAVLLLLPTSNGLAKTDDVALTPDKLL